MRRLYFLVRGHVILSSVDSDGMEQQAAIRSGPALLGVEALRGAQAPYEVRALDAARVCSLPQDEADDWLGSAPPTWRALLGLLSSEMDRLRQDLGLRRGSSLQRVARFLYQGATHTNSLLGMPKQDVARMLGIRAETFSRCLAHLKERGHIRVTRGEVRVVNAAALAALQGDGLA